MAKSRVKGILVEIGGDTSGLQKALSKVNGNISSLSKELKDVNSLLKLDPKNTELANQKQKLLNDSIKETSSKLEELKEAQRLADEQIANGTEISDENYRALQREILETENKLKSLKAEASNWTKAGRSIEEFGNKVTNISSKIDKLGTTLTTRLTLPITAVGTYAVNSFKEVDEGADIVIKKTGAVGDSAEALKDVYKRVSSSVVGDFGDVGSAVGEINTRFGFTGEALEEASEKFLKFAKINDTDVNTAVQKVSRYMGDASIEASKYGEVLDQLSSVAQASGISIDSLSEMLTKYGAPMRALGLNTKESIAIFAGWEKAGVNTEIAFSGMKKAIGTWGKEGKNATKEFKKTLEQIKKCPDIASATTKAIAVFGQKAGPDLADAIKGGRFEYSEFLDILEKSEGTLENTYNGIIDETDEVQMSMKKLKVQFSEVGKEALKTLVPTLEKILDGVSGLISSYNKLDDKQKKQINNMIVFAAAIGPATKLLGTLGKTAGTSIKTVGNLSQAIGLIGKTSTDAFKKASTETQSYAKILTALTSPLGLITVALAGTTIATSLLLEETTKNNRAIADSSKELENTKNKYDELVETQNNKMNATLSEVDNTKKLSDELKTLVDENGKVKSGYEDRVKFILSELKKSLGIEYDMTGDVIKNYKELSQTIDELMIKKRANAILENEEAKYNEAFDKKTNAYDTMIQKENELAKAKQELANYEEKLNSEEAKRNTSMWSYYRTQIDVSKKAVQQAETNLNTSKQIYDNYLNDIATYENDFSIVQSGNNEKIQEMIRQRSYSYQQGSNDIGETINHNIAQAQYEVEQYQIAREKDLANQDEMNAKKNQAQIDAGNNQILKLAEQLAQMTSTTEEMTPQQVDAWKRLANDSYGIYSQIVSQMAPEMQQKIQDTTGVLAWGTPQMQEKAEKLGRKTVDEFDKSADAKEKALNVITGYLTGLSDEEKREFLKKAGIENADIVIDELNKGNLSEENGKNILEGLWRGLNNGTWKGKILGVASGLAQAVNKAFTGKNGWDEHSPSKKMKKFAEYYVQPISDVMKSRQKDIVSSAREMANAVNSAFNNQMNFPQIHDFGKLQGKLSNKIIDSTKTVYTTPNLTIYTQEFDARKIADEVNKVFGSQY